MLFKIVVFRKVDRVARQYSLCTIPAHLQVNNLPWELQSPILLIIYPCTILLGVETFDLLPLALTFFTVLFVVLTVASQSQRLGTTTWLTDTEPRAAHIQFSWAVSRPIWDVWLSTQRRRKRRRYWIDTWWIQYNIEYHYINITIS